MTPDAHRVETTAPTRTSRAPLAPRGAATRQHFVRESDVSRCKCIAAYRALDGVTILIYEHRGHGNHPSINGPSA